jgi:hypothetical protein
MLVSTPSTSSWVNCRASSYFVLHSKPGSSIGFGQTMSIAIHGALEANIDLLPRMHLGPVTAGKGRKLCVSNFRWSWVTDDAGRLLLSTCSGDLHKSRITRAK